MHLCLPIDCMVWSLEQWKFDASGIINFVM